jgi:hypothetical protein
MKFVFILVGIAIALEVFGPFVLSKVFPASLVNSAPDVPVRPKRTGSRNDSYVDDAMGNLADVQSPTTTRLFDRGESEGLVSSSAFAALTPSSATPDSFDYDEFRRENESVRPTMAAAEPMEISQGVPDMFDDSVSGIHA